MVFDGRVFRIPVKSTAKAKEAPETAAPAPTASAAPVGETVSAVSASAQDTSATISSAENETLRDYVRAGQSGEVDWQTVALRLQADAQAYRQRQALRDAQRLAEERERLLLPFLEVVDNLERTLDAVAQAKTPQDAPLYQGLEVTYRGMRNLLEREGVTAIDAVGAPFDPILHEAVAARPGTAAQNHESVVVEEVRRGYRQGERVLRPARVIVAGL